MKQTLVSLGLFTLTNFSFGQNTECENIKVENNTLKTTITALNNENSYLKKVLDINKTITETNAHSFNFKIIKAIGDIKTKTILFTLLIENQNDKDMFFSTNIGSFIIDIEGNKPKRDFENDINTDTKLVKNIPTKVVIAFKYSQFENEPPRIIKVLNYEYSFNEEYRIADRENAQLKNINIIWK